MNKLLFFNKNEKNVSVDSREENELSTTRLVEYLNSTQD